MASASPAHRPRGARFDHERGGGSWSGHERHDYTQIGEPTTGPVWVAGSVSSSPPPHPQGC